MNGRIYDPRLGRFLQADPIVQAPKYSQSLNRYTYVFNNPLSYTDPSGYEGFLVASVVSSFFAFIADKLNHPEDQISTTSPNDFLKQNSVPGALSNAFGDQTGRIDKEQFTNIDATSATIGGTTSAETAGKFANGGNSWSYVQSQSEMSTHDKLRDQATAGSDGSNPQDNFQTAKTKVLEALKSGRLRLGIDDDEIVGGFEGIEIILVLDVENGVADVEMSFQTYKGQQIGGINASIRVDHQGAITLEEAYRSIGHEIRHISRQNRKLSDIDPDGPGPALSEQERDAERYGLITSIELLEDD